MDQKSDFSAFALAYVNGRVMPQFEAFAELQRINSRAGGGLYDSSRTFGGIPFRLRRHIDRLFRGLAYSNIDAGVTADEMEAASRGLIEANSSLLDPGGDMVVTQTVYVTRPGASDYMPGVDVAIYCTPIDFAAFARSYVDGVRLYTPATYPKPQEDAAPEDGKPENPHTLPLMVNQNGHITECQGANFMFVVDGRIKLPDRRNVLPGVSMGAILELAGTLGVPVDEGLYSPTLVYRADEAFVSSTRWCMLPVRSLNGYRIGDSPPGPVTRRLTESWKEMVRLDFVRQALDALPDS